MYKVNIPEGKIGQYSIETFTIKEGDPLLIRYAIQGRAINPGIYTCLIRGRTLIMSDTPAEMKDHMDFIIRATGKVLIAGLGIGMVLDAVAKKEAVTHVTVIEIASEVIDLVGPTYKERYGNKIEIIHASIFDWKPEKHIKYDYAWYDIWDDFCVDNLKEMEKLHRKFGKKVSVQGSWGKELLKKREKEINAFSYFRRS